MGCQEFRCQLLAGYGDETDRPDKSKVVIDYIEFADGKILSIWEVTESAINRRFAREVTSFGLETLRIPVVHALLPDEKTVLFPDGTRRNILPEEDITH
jgi:hypothetical protein